MADNIKHLGFVESINGAYVRVRIEQTSACSGCSVKGHCHASESKEQVLEAYNAEGKDYQIGQPVYCCISSSLGLRAVVLAFVLPFVLIFAVLFATMKFTHGNELLSSSLSLAVLIPYYILIYTLRKHISRTFSIRLESLNN